MCELLKKLNCHSSCSSRVSVSASHGAVGIAVALAACGLGNDTPDDPELLIATIDVQYIYSLRRLGTDLTASFW